MDKNSMEGKLARAIYKNAFGKVSITEAQEIAENAIDNFIAGCKESSSLAHKGLDWYAKEIVKTL